MSNSNTIAFNLTVDNADAQEKFQQTTDALKAMGVSAKDAEDAYKRLGTSAVRAQELIGQMSANKAEREITRFQTSLKLSRDDAELLQKALRKDDGSAHFQVGLRDGMNELQSFAGMLGIQLPQALEKYAARMQGLQPLMTSAFKIAAVIGVIEVLEQVPRAFDKISGAITGWDEKAKEAYGDFIQLNRNAVQEAEQLRLKIGEIKTIGKSGTTKDVLEGAELQDAISRQTQTNQAYLRALTAINDQRTARQNVVPPATAAMADAYGTSGLDVEANRKAYEKAYPPGSATDEELKTQAANIAKSLDEGTKTLKSLQLQQKQQAAQTSADILSETQRRVTAEIEAERRKYAALTELRQANVTAHLDAARISATEAALMEQRLETERYQGDNAALAKRIENAKLMRAQDAAAADVELKTLYADQEVLASQHAAKMIELGRAVDKALQSDQQRVSDEAQHAIAVGLEVGRYQRPSLPVAGPPLEGYEIDAYRKANQALQQKIEQAKAMRGSDAVAAETELRKLYAEQEALAKGHAAKLLAISHQLQSTLEDDLTRAAGDIQPIATPLPTPSPVEGKYDYEIEAEMKRARTLQALRETEAKSRLSLGILTGRQELAIQQQIENEEYALVQRGLEDRRRLAEQMQVYDPVAGKKALVEAAGESEVAAIEHQRKLLELTTEYQARFITSFRDSAGRVWDDFFQRGQNILTSLANMAKGLLNTIGRTLFQDFAAGLLSPRGLIGRGLGSIADGSSIGGRILGAVGVGSGAASTATAGSIFGGIGDANAMGGTLGLGVAGAGPGIPATGFTGLLGLHGGAGLFGLGGWTMPVIGGSILGAIGLYKLLHHKPPADIGADPYANVAAQTYHFNSTFPFERLNNAITDLNNTMRRLDATVATLDTKDPGVVTKEGFSAIKADVQDTVLRAANTREYGRGLWRAISGAPV